VFFQQEPQEQILVIPLLRFECPICGNVVWTIFTQNEKPMEWKCSKCGCYFLNTINNYETWEQNIEWLKTQWI
jgi:transcription elongation factor Elf1